MYRDLQPPSLSLKKEQGVHPLFTRQDGELSPRGSSKNITVKQLDIGHGFADKYSPERGNTGAGRINIGEFERANTFSGYAAQDNLQSQTFNRSFGQPGFPRNIEEIIASMAKKITDQHIQNFAEFFYQYDVYQSRQFESWELAIIFLDYITLPEAEIVINELNDGRGGYRMLKTIDYQVLVKAIQRKSPYIQPGQVGIQSQYTQKFKSQSVQQFLDHIISYFKQNGLDPVRGFDQYFNKSYISDREFMTFLTQINLRTHNQQEQYQLFEYFTLGTNLFSKINFVQALNALSTLKQQSSYGSQMTATNQFNSTSLPNQLQVNFPLQTLVNEIKVYMQQKNCLSFEGFLSFFQIPNQPYIDCYQFENILTGLNLIFQPDEMNQIMSVLDDERKGQVKIWNLRQQIEVPFQHSNTQPFNYNNPPSSRYLSNNQQYDNNQPSSAYQSNNQQNGYQPFTQQPSYGQQPYGTQSFNSSFGYHPTQQPTPMPNYKLGYNPNMQQLLDRIKIFFEKQTINMDRFFTTTCLYPGKNTVVVELDEFLQFLKFPSINFSENEAFEFSQEFLIKDHMNYKSQYYIDLQQFQKQVFSGQSAKINQGFEYHRIIQNWYESAKKYLLMKGGNLISFFKEMDMNKDNFISKEELKICLQKLENTQVSDDEVNIVFSKIDENNDGRISYNELCKQFADYSNTKAIKDMTHWSFPIFEGIRKKALLTGQSLSQLFGINIQSMNQKVLIAKNQFFSALARLGINFFDNQQQRLLELLDADKSQQYEIDFIHFSELVGIDYDKSTYYNDFIKNAQISDIDVIYRQKSKTFYKSLYQILQLHEMSIELVKVFFKKSDLGNKGVALQNDFIGIISEIDQQRLLDQNLVREMSDKFITTVGMQRFINYPMFLNRLEGEMEKYKFIDYLFLTFMLVMKNNQISTLKEFFQRFDKDIQFGRFDKTTIEKLLQSQNITFLPHEISMLLLEYDPKGTGQYLLFEELENDFEMFKSSSSNFKLHLNRKQELHSKYKDFSKSYGGFDFEHKNQNNFYDYFDSPKKFSSHNKNYNLNLKNQPAPIVIEILQKVARTLENMPTFNFANLLREHDYTHTGNLSKDSFEDILMRSLTMRRDEIQQLHFHYDPLNRNEIQIQDFLTDVKEYIHDHNIKLQIVQAIQDFEKEFNSGFTRDTRSHIQSDVILKRFQKDFEEIQKAIFVRQSDTYKWFTNYSNNRQSLIRDDFREAIRVLNIQYLRPGDIDQIFDALEPDRRGNVDIQKIDDALRNVSSQSGMQMQDELLEKIIRAYNGDDAFILRELSTLDKSGRGYLNCQIFIDFFIRNSPSHIKLSQNDLGYLANRYIDSLRSPTDVDVNKFHSDLTRIKGLKKITTGYYSDQGKSDQGTTNDNFNDNRYPGGHRNPLLPQFSKDNTQASQNKIQKFPGFRINIQMQYLEDIAKAAYVKGQLVEEYFQRATQRGSLYEADFARAIQNLDLGWSNQTCNLVFSEVDKAFNNQRSKMMITAENIDQAVSFGLQRTLEDIHQEMIETLAQHVSQRGLNLQSEIQSYDMRQQKLVKVEDMIEIILNRLRAPQFMKNDVIFLCKRYIETVANMVHYEKLLDDVESITRGKYSNIGDLKQICDYIRKACILNQNSLEQHFIKYSRTKDMYSQQEFIKAISDLDLIQNGICNKNQIISMYNEIDISGRAQVTNQQIAHYINKLSFKQTKEFQEDIIEDICSRASAQNLIMENIFQQEDRALKGYVTQEAFERILTRQLQAKLIDAKLLANKYKERLDNINYRIFITDQQNREKQNKRSIKIEQNNNATINEQIKNMLRKINDFVLQKRLQLSNAFAQYERGQSSGILTNSQFIAALNSLKLPISQNEKQSLSEYYSNPRQPENVNYLQFLSDMKLFGGNFKTLQSLTTDQKELYNKVQAYVAKNNIINKILIAIQENDSKNKGYLTQHQVKEAFTTNGMQLSPKQFTILFSPLDTNQYGEYNYKQLFDLMYGPEEANRLFSFSSGSSSKPKQIGQKFIMPQQPINASNSIMANIGRNMIQSNINYEEELKRILGPTQAAQPSPKAQDTDIIAILRTCKVYLSQDENVEFQTFVAQNKDRNGLIDVLLFLKAVGLSPQTLGPNAEKPLPKKILNEKELAECQNIIIKLREETMRQKRNISQIFDRVKQQTSDLTLPPITFKITIATEFGQAGKVITDQQFELLTYYLQQEVPGQISMKKLYLAFTLSDREPPLKQEGTQEIKKYMDKMQEQLKKGIPLEVIDLGHFMKQNGLSMQQIFKNTQKGIITRQEFELSLKEAGFQSKNINKLVEVLDTKQTRTSVSLDRLNEYLRKASPEGREVTPQIARDRQQGFDPKTRQDLQKISDFMKRNNIALQKLYEEMDVNRDGTVDKQEFVNRLAYMNIPGLQLSEIGQIFDAIDINNDNFLSVNEFGMFIEGAKMSRMQRIQELDPKMMDEMKGEIQTLFQSFDENGDGFVTADEILKSMMALGQRITLQDAKDMISSVDLNGDGKVDLREFTELMLPKMKDELLNQEDSMEDLRAMFLEADIDHSGTLSIDEIYSVILKMGAEITIEELIELMNEIDVDRNGELDIDEFVALMNMGDDIQFRSANAKNTFLNIKKSRKLNPLDFFKCFKNMPMNFVPSFLFEKWTKYRKNLPSSVFKPQIDPKTMLYKDMLPVLSENIPPSQNQRAFQPRVRPLATQLGCQITLDGCEGVPIPASGSGFDRNQIVKRAVRVALYDTLKKDFIHNAVQINALYNTNVEDVWNFSAQKENGTNPVLFKTSQKDEICKPHIFLVFELVVYVKFGEKITEMCCGWCQLEPTVLDRQMTHKLQIKGGSPNAEVLIKDSDVRTNRTGVKYIMKVIQSKINSQLTVSIRPHLKFTEETKFHLDLLPSTCLIQKRLLYFVSGFRNYAAEKLLKESSMNTFKHPEGDVIISSFPKILDCPDIIDLLIPIWHEDVWATISAKQKLNVEFIMMKSKEFIQKLYPILYAEEFKFKETYPTHSASGDQYLMRKREDLIKSALRYGSSNPKTKFDQPIEALTTFKPFTVRELEFEVWDTSQAKQDKYLKQYEEMGLVRGDNNSNAPANYNNAYPSSFDGQQPLGQQNPNSKLPPYSSQPLSLSNALNNAFGK